MKSFGVLLAFSLLGAALGDYKIGVGRADCTGPVTEIIFMGYAVLSQVGCGLHLRQFSRAFIVDDGANRVVFVSSDSQSMAYGVRREIFKNLAAKYGDLYTDKNVIMSGTHTHSGPGGWLQDLMFDIPNLGFVPESFDSLVEGITQSIVNAHESLVDGKVFLSAGELLDANINRSPASYLLNPEEERARYEYNVDKDLVQLKFVRSSDGVAIGALNWFAVHPTSMNNTNCLVSSDNVGYASILLEGHVNAGSLPGQGEFVGAFSASNLGDVSPNIKGPICIDTGEECDFYHSTCNGSAAFCIASGPGDNMVESTRIIAERIFAKAEELFHLEDAVELTGPVNSIHQFVDMPKETATITLDNGTEVEIQGCPPAMGYAFAGGTTDGPGEFDFTQNTLTSNPFWNAVRNFLFPPTEEEIACHAPKPILINTGSVDFPYPWQPRIVSTQILTIGDVALIGVPGEFTTMSGRRLRDAVRDTIIANGGSENTRAILAGHSNVYTNYIATPEEYQLQRYEGASTIFGPNTLNLYLSKYRELAAALMTGKALDPGPTPPDFSAQLLTLVFPAATDAVTGNQSFGDVLQQPPETVSVGDTVSVRFVGGNPRHDSQRGGSFLYVEALQADDSFAVVATDASWDTRLIWKRVSSGPSQSEITVEWDVGAATEPGTYRIRHSGHYKSSSGALVAYQGLTELFTVQ